MSGSLAALRGRLKTLQQIHQKRQARSALYDESEFTTLPKVTEWSKFARLCSIRTAGTVAPFIPFEYQERFVDSINQHPNTIVLKSRQTGISETVCNYLLCRALTERGFAAVVFSKTQTDASELGRRVRAMANSIKGENVKYLTDSNIQLSFEGRGQIYFLPATARAARGIPSASVLVLDEAGFLEGAEEIYTAAMPTLSMVGDKAKVIVVSTPNTSNDFFGRLWHGTDGDWNKVKIHYSEHPIYGADPNWATDTRISRRMSMAAWNTEYELEFGATDAQIYPLALVQKCSTGRWRECGSIRRDYILAIDPNAGGNDYFCALVLDITEDPIEVVGYYRENGRSTQYSLTKIGELIENFLPSKIICEHQAMGSVIAEAISLQYPKSAIETFNTTRPSKITATDRLVYLMENGRLIFPPGFIADELLAFRQLESGAREASVGAHDDSVMALAIGCSLVPDTPQTAAFFANI